MKKTVITIALTLLSSNQVIATESYDSRLSEECIRVANELDTLPDEVSDETLFLGKKIVSYTYQESQEVYNFFHKCEENAGTSGSRSEPRTRKLIWLQNITYQLEQKKKEQAKKEEEKLALDKEKTECMNQYLQAKFPEDKADLLVPIHPSWNEGYSHLVCSLMKGGKATISSVSPGLLSKSFGILLTKENKNIEVLFKTSELSPKVIVLNRLRINEKDYPINSEYPMNEIYNVLLGFASID
ncbi:MAG: hypothetical protein IPN42_16710 [Methylococcaceae bacterium]|nr:hypothetical protein [Methylococcaceae bacterium]